MASQTWYGCQIPEDLLYDVELNVWVRFEGDQAVIGMTDVSQTLCGRFVQVTWKRPGRTIKRGRGLLVVESAKWVGPVRSPLSGVIVENNDSAFEADIAVANRDPYGDGWLVCIQPTDLDEERHHLDAGDLAFEKYRSFIEENDIRCFRCED
ncbi:MAG: glycine cleavage system protein H [Acidimicrobiia bacterium]|nr:glycine cleavage system protein H [Acidimicrobiia bacterium]